MNKPKIRFKGFNDDWEQRKLGELASIYDGVHKTPNYKDSGIMFLSVENIITLKSKKYISEEDFERDYKVHPERGDIFMTRIGDVGTTNVVESSEKLAFYVSLALLKPIDSYPYFLNNAMKTNDFQMKLRKRTLVTAIPQKINKDEIGKLELFITYNFVEQKKIGDYFRKLDQLITLHQRKCDEIKKLKKYMLQNIFPQDGEKVPKIRFGGFNDDWEQRKLGELGSVSMCRRIFKEQTSERGDIPFYKIGTFGAVADAFISKELFEEYKLKYPYPKKGDILISASGSIGRTVEFTGKNEYFQDSNIVWLNHDERLSNTFLKCFYSVVKWTGIEGSTIKRLYNDNILNTVINLPSIHEQNKIGAYFAKIDNLITLHQWKWYFFDKKVGNAWEQRKLGELASIYDGVHKTPNYKDSGIMFLSVENIITLKSKKYISEEDFERDYKVHPERGDIFMTRIGDVGTTNVVESSEKLAFYVSLALLKPIDSYPYFLNNAMKTNDFQMKLRKRTLVTAIPQKINKDEIGKLELFITYNFVEQKKIGDYFRKLDQLITLHQRKCDEIKKLKKYMLQNIFPQDGEKVPKIRFGGFNDDWEQRKLGELGSVSMCRRIFKEQTSERGDIPFYKIGTFGAVADAFISKELFEEYKLKYPYPKKGDILISASGSIGRTVEFTGKNEYFQDSNIVWLNHDERLSNTFLKCFYSVVKWTGIEGSTIKRLYNDNILNTVINLPSIHEQNKIGAYFAKIDNLITLHQQKCDQLKNMKKFMLQNMFV